MLFLFISLPIEIRSGASNFSGADYSSTNSQAFQIETWWSFLFTGTLQNFQIVMKWRSRFIGALQSSNYSNRKVMKITVCWDTKPFKTQARNTGHRTRNSPKPFKPQTIQTFLTFQTLQTPNAERGTLNTEHKMVRCRHDVFMMLQILRSRYAIDTYMSRIYPVPFKERNIYVSIA